MGTPGRIAGPLAGAGPLAVVAAALRDHPGYLALTVVLLGLLAIGFVHERGRLRRERDVDVTLAAAKVYQAGGDGAAVVRALDE